LGDEEGVKGAGRRKSGMTVMLYKTNQVGCTNTYAKAKLSLAF
jgi:hypothetical protein